MHDSNGLQIHTGHDEAIWRPLTNPRDLQISAFQDTGPRGFGLMQRKRAFVDYQDLESRYEKRPSLWVEPIGDWGQGVVELVEIPSDREVNDNMVAFWRPHDPLRAKGEYLLNYRLHWCWAPPGEVKLAQVMQTRCGLSFDQKHRQFIIDFVGESLKGLKPDSPPTLDVGADKGKIVSAVTRTQPRCQRLACQHRARHAGQQAGGAARSPDAGRPAADGNLDLSMDPGLTETG